MLELYHWEPNANSGKPMLALREKGTAFISHYVDMLKFDHHRPDYLMINRDGTIPTMVHDGFVLTESTPMMEYIDEVFTGPSLRPADPQERWRMRWWMRFCDWYLAPSISMLAWSVLIRPAMADRDPMELEAAIEKIPLESRRIAWRKALFGEFAPDELAESRRRAAFGIAMLEGALSGRPWLAGSSYSIGDIAGFNVGYALPISQPALANDEKTPRLMEWLRKIYERPAVKETWAMGRTRLAERARILERR